MYGRRPATEARFPINIMNWEKKKKKHIYLYDEYNLYNKKKIQSI